MPRTSISASKTHFGGLHALILPFSITMPRVSLVFALFITVCYGDLTINVPSRVVECQPAQITWSGGSGSVELSIQSQGDGGQTENSFGGQTSPFTWSVNIPAGSSVTISVSDETGAEAQSGTINVQGGSDDSCVGTGPVQITTTSTAPTTTTSTAVTSASESSSSFSCASSLLYFLRFWLWLIYVLHANYQLYHL